MGPQPFPAADVANDPDAVFAALREAVFEDAHLLNTFRPLGESEPFVARVVAVAGARGLPVATATVRAMAGRHAKRPGDAYHAGRDPNRAGEDAFRARADAIVGPALAALRGAS